MSKSKRKTIGKMSQTRGVMPPPTVVDVDKRKKKDRKQVKQQLRSGNYDA
ncbi:hypothetical protein [Priestia megaterium]|jgi:hypothetical protein|nr:hypothetical protein [Priestia megaterium]